MKWFQLVCYIQSGPTNLFISKHRLFESQGLTCVPHADDAIAILAAFNCEEVQIVGMTTIFGNIPTSKATQNAVRLRELAAEEQVPTFTLLYLSSHFTYQA